jgi:calcium-dependent protein kinase
VIYKNLKTSNIVVASKEKFLVKVIGFEDLSELCRDSEIDISYQAPETFREDYVWNQSADIWSAVVVLFELETGIHPFRAETRRKTIENIREHNFEEIDEWNELNEDTRILIAKMLEMYPKMRLPAKLCLKSRYFKSI